MDELINSLLQKEKALTVMIERAEKFLKKAPSGTLRISISNDKEQFYHRTDPKDTIGTYIKKGNTKLIQNLAQKEYAKKVLSIAQKQKAAIRQVIAVCQQNDIMKAYQKLSPFRRKIITPYILPDQD